jgi:hypothetical protein
MRTPLMSTFRAVWRPAALPTTVLEVSRPVGSFVGGWPPWQGGARERSENLRREASPLAGKSESSFRFVRPSSYIRESTRENLFRVKVKSPFHTHCVSRKRPGLLRVQVGIRNVLVLQSGSRFLNDLWHIGTTNDRIKVHNAVTRTRPFSLAL